MSADERPLTGAAVPATLVTTVDALRRVWNALVLDDGFRCALAFVPRADDVMLACYLKCGTTWLQQIAHGLRTGGDMGFTNIEHVVPYMERAHGLGIDINGPQVAAPRLFKTHLDHGRVPKGARYIIVLRDPGDALVSLYHFFRGTLFEPDAISLETFAVDFYLGDTGPYMRYWEHLVSWFAAPETSSRLFLCFEDMVDDLPTATRAIAGFMGIDADASTLDRVVRQSSFAFMKAHSAQFAPVNAREGADSAAVVRFETVRRGRVGGHRRTLSPAVKSRMAQIWSEVVSPVTGCAHYDDLRARLAGRASGP